MCVHMCIDIYMSYHLRKNTQGMDTSCGIPRVKPEVFHKLKDPFSVSSSYGVICMHVS